MRSQAAIVAGFLRELGSIAAPLKYFLSDFGFCGFW